MYIKSMLKLAVIVPLVAKASIAATLTPSQTNNSTSNIGHLLPQSGYLSFSKNLISIPMDDGLTLAD